MGENTEVTGFAFQLDELQSSYRDLLMDGEAEEFEFGEIRKELMAIVERLYALGGVDANKGGCDDK